MRRAANALAWLYERVGALLAAIGGGSLAASAWLYRKARRLRKWAREQLDRASRP